MSMAVRHLDLLGLLMKITKLFISSCPSFESRSDSPKGHGLTTNNARIENIKDSKLYKHSLESKQRCVVICDGKS